MSYCRWSSMDHRCDLYCYEDANGGWTTHVASRRRIHTTPPPPSELDYIAEIIATDQKIDPVVWNKRRKIYRNWLESLPWEDVPEVHTGQSFNDPDLESFKARLLDLREKGYIFPDHVLEEVDEELRNG